jgi:hypothetical protein
VRGLIRRFSYFIRRCGRSVVGLRGAVGYSRGTIRVGNLFAIIIIVQQQVSQNGS